MNKTLKQIIDFLIIFFVSLCMLGIFVSDTFLFRAKHSSYQDDNRIIKLTTSDGGEISAAYYKVENAKATILLSHGNGNDIGMEKSFTADANKNGYNVMLYDYYGYGTSSGSPSEANSYLAVEAAYKYLVTNKKIPSRKIIAYGHSLGSGMATYIAATKPVGALIIDGGFVTAFRVITVFPLLPFDKFRNITRIKNITIPKLIIHGNNDEIISFWHGPALYEAAPSPKDFLWVKDAGHENSRTVAGKEYWKKWQELVNTMNKFNY